MIFKPAKTSALVSIAFEWTEPQRAVGAANGCAGRLVRSDGGVHAASCMKPLTEFTWRQADDTVEHLAEGCRVSIADLPCYGVHWLLAELQ